jgi:hypothetical protein
VEWRRDELVAAIAGGRVRVLSRDARLEDTLGRLLERGKEGT